MDKKDWNKTDECLPDDGILCIVYFPVGVKNLTNKTTGPIAMAYHRQKEGWVYADTPSQLRFIPYYWRAWDNR